MKLSRNIPIIVLVLITLLIGFVITRKLKNKTQLETQQLKIEESDVASETDSDTEIEGFTVTEGFDATSIITESMAKKILGIKINDTLHKQDGIPMKPGSWDQVKKMVLSASFIDKTSNYTNDLKNVVTEANKTEGNMKIKGNWEALTRYKTVNELLGKFIIVKARNNPSKYKIVYKKKQGWITTSKLLYDSYEDALKAAMDKNGEVIKGIGKLAADQEVRHLTQDELDIIVQEESGSGNQEESGSGNQEESGSGNQEESGSGNQEESDSSQAFVCEVNLNGQEDINIDVKTCGISQTLLDEFNKIKNGY